jgi:hypothetical protein
MVLAPSPAATVKFLVATQFSQAASPKVGVVLLSEKRIFENSASQVTAKFTITELDSAALVRVIQAQWVLLNQW